MKRRRLYSGLGALLVLFVWAACQFFYQCWLLISAVLRSYQPPSNYQQQSYRASRPPETRKRRNPRESQIRKQKADLESEITALQFSLQLANLKQQLRGTIERDLGLERWMFIVIVAFLLSAGCGIAAHFLLSSLVAGLALAGVAAYMIVGSLLYLLFIPEDFDILHGIRSQSRDILDKKSKIETLDETLSSLALESPWQHLWGSEWEVYVAELLRNRGFEVEVVGRCDVQGVDIIAARGEWRVAIQAKGWADSVGISAVQEVVAGQCYWNCNACAVVSNSTFTSPARELGQATGCVLIDADNLTELAVGEIDPWP